MDIFNATYRFELSHLEGLVAHLDFAQLAHGETRLARVLAPAEKVRLSRSGGRARLRSLAAMALARSELGERLSLAPEDVPLSRTTHGKPVLDPECDLHFNLAHSGEHLLFAVSSRAPIGVDIETTARAPESVIRRFPADEQAALARLREPASPRAFGHLWAAKEACIKCRGRGGSISSVEVSLEQGGRWRDVAWERIELDRNIPGVIAMQVG